MRKQGNKTIWFAVAFLLWGLAASPVEADERADQWAALSDQGENAGVESARIRAAIRHCRDQSLSPLQAREMLGPLWAAQEDGLPPGWVFAKVEEGLAKNVDPKQIRRVAEQRLALLKTTRTLLQTEADGSMQMNEGLLLTTAQALESGVPRESLERVLAEAGTHRSGRVMHVVEAGETLHLAGFDAAEVEAFMADFMERELRRSEIRRAVRYATERHRRGMSQENARHTLWGNHATGTPGSGLQRHRRQGGENAPGRGSTGMGAGETPGSLGSGSGASTPGAGPGTATGPAAGSAGPGNDGQGGKQPQIGR